MEQETVKKLAQLMGKLEQTDMEQFFQMLMLLWERLYPEYELLLASLPKNDFEGRKRVMEFAMRMIESQETENK